MYYSTDTGRGDASENSIKLRALHSTCTSSLIIYLFLLLSISSPSLVAPSYVPTTLPVLQVVPGTVQGNKNRYMVILTGACLDEVGNVKQEEHAILGINLYSGCAYVRMYNV